jgi:hypothetical protein
MEFYVHTGPIAPFWRHTSSDYDHYWISTDVMGEELSWDFLFGDRPTEWGEKISVSLLPRETNTAKTISYEVIYSPEYEYPYCTDNELAEVVGSLLPDQYEKVPKPDDRVRLSLKIKLDVSETPPAPEQCMAQVSRVETLLPSLLSW